LGRVTARECPTGVDDLLTEYLTGVGVSLTAAFAKGYIYSGESRSALISCVLRLEFGTGYYSKTFVIDHM